MWAEVEWNSGQSKLANWPQFSPEHKLPLTLLNSIYCVVLFWMVRVGCMIRSRTSPDIDHPTKIPPLVR